MLPAIEKLINFYKYSIYINRKIVLDKYRDISKKEYLTDVDIFYDTSIQVSYTYNFKKILNY